jgi:Zn-dependent peptidase ImmA (M78 family)/transcriptional regulator with XRE-family HTH domain
MAIDGATIGQRILEARARAGLTQADLARAAGLERSAIAKIELGVRRVTASELAQIAEHLGRRLDWFVTPSPDTVVSHRVRQDSAGETSSIDLELETIARDVELVASLEPGLLDRTIDPVDPPDSIRQADELSARAREWCGVNPVEPFLDLVGAFADVGLLAFSERLSGDTADAGTILLEKGAVSLINSESKVGRRRIALAHEFGHYLVADDYTVDWRVTDHSASQRNEVLLERFARSLLLPETALREYWAQRIENDDVRTAALRTASHFRVDMSTLARRLQELGAATNGDLAQVRDTKTTKADIVELNLLVPYDLEETSLPRRYELAILRLYRNEKISGERALQLLRGTHDDSGLPILPPVSASEIWQVTS